MHKDLIETEKGGKYPPADGCATDSYLHKFYNWIDHINKKNDKVQRNKKKSREFICYESPFSLQIPILMLKENRSWVKKYHDGI